MLMAFVQNCQDSKVLLLLMVTTNYVYNGYLHVEACDRLFNDQHLTHTLIIYIVCDRPGSI